MITSLLLQLVVVISNGNFIPLNTTTFPTAVIRQNKTKLLVYKLPVNSDSDPTSDPFLINTTLPSVLCGVQGSFEVLEAPATANPLYALRGYFSFLAQTHQDAVNSKPTWSNVYRSVAQSLDAVTVTAPGKIGFITLLSKHHLPVSWSSGAKFDGKVDLNRGCGGVFFSD